MTLLAGKRLTLRPVDETDSDTVVRWRNSDEARAAFWCTDVVTPDTHKAFLANRRPHEFVWMALEGHNRVGMGALTVDVQACQAEWGKIFIDANFRRGGYGREMVTAALKYAFATLNLRRVWIEAWQDNTAILDLYKRLGFAYCTPEPGIERRARPTTFMELTREMWKGAQA